MYNDAINAADNWRKNYDIARARVDYYYGKWQDASKRPPMFLIIGIMIGVLGTLLAAQAFNI